MHWHISTLKSTFIKKLFVCDSLVPFPFFHLKKTTFYYEILIQRVVLWIFTLIILKKKDHTKRPFSPTQYTK